MNEISSRAVVNFSGGPFDGTVSVTRGELDRHMQLRLGDHLEAAVRVWHLILLIGSEGVSAAEMIGTGVACYADIEKSVTGVPHRYTYERIEHADDVTEIDVRYSGIIS